jgi:FAD/FMN-containing dehydrogenase
MPPSNIPFVNFGGNVECHPSAIVVPENEADVLAALDNHRGRSMHAIGRRHSWSEAAVGDDVLLDLRKLDAVRVDTSGPEPIATIGSGCQIKHVLTELDRHGLTLPSVGLISEQTIAGAISTATHGSGRHSLAHYVSAVTLATYDPATSEPILRTLSAGDELRAARCSLGTLGIITAVEIPVRGQYLVEEHLREYRELADVLAAEEEFPLQQFYLVPWRWTYLAQHRREVSGRPRSLLAPLYRAYWFAIIDVGLHVLLQVLVKMLRSAALVRGFYRWLVLLFVIRGWRVIDQSDRQLIMEHELFRHIEIELFVGRSRLAEALDFVRQVLTLCAGETSAVAPHTRAKLTELQLTDQLDDLAETYTHHYAICVRQVLRDDTLISMTSGAGEPSYAISLISYARPDERGSFLALADFLTRSMTRLFAARPHWGKVCPLSPDEAEVLYPRLAEFRAICRRYDPAGVFQNRWTRPLLWQQPSREE